MIRPPSRYSIINFDQASKYFTGWLVPQGVEPRDAVAVILGAIILEWLVLYYLYQKKIFLRV